MSKLTNSSPDHHKTSKSSNNLTYASTDNLHAEMTALNYFVLDEIHMLKKKSDGK